MLQRTIKNSVEIVGIGLHKGVPIKMKLEPMPEDSGINFYRSDLGVAIPLKIENVVDTTLATVISREGVKISTIEHLCSAIYSYGIDNMLISVDNEEIPIMDGSSMPFCILLEEARVLEQKRAKKLLRIKKEVSIKEKNKEVTLLPSSTPVYEFKIDFDHPVIREQSFAFNFSTTNYRTQIAKARTFGFLHEVQYLRSKNLALGGSLQNAIVLDDKKILNSDGLRYNNEFVRHKILDAIGDLSLLGMPILGRYRSFAGSHNLNHLLTLELLKSSDCYEIIPFEEVMDLKLKSCYAKAYS